MLNPITGPDAGTLKPNLECWHPSLISPGDAAKQTCPEFKVSTLIIYNNNSQPIACVAAVPYNKLIVHGSKKPKDGALTLRWTLDGTAITTPPELTFVKKALSLKQSDDESGDEDDGFDFGEPADKFSDAVTSPDNRSVTVDVKADFTGKKVAFNHLLRVRYKSNPSNLPGLPKFQFRCTSIDPVIVTSAD